MNKSIHIHNEDGNGMSIEAVKGITMVVLCMGSILVGVVPWFLAMKWKWISPSKDSGNLKTENKVVVGLLAFGGGVLLCTTFMHLLPEVDEGVEKLQEDGILPDLPFYLAPLLMCAGFFMLYLIEELVHLYLNAQEKKSGLVRTMSIRRNDPRLEDDQNTDTEKSDYHLNNGQQYHAENQINNHGHSHMIPTSEESNVIVNIRSLLIVLALSIHELFEGLAIGLENTTNKVWYMFAAVASHKYVIAFCIGMELMNARSSALRYFGNILLFSVVTPVGIGLGLWLLSGTESAATDITSVVAQGLATGTLMYVVFFEVLKQSSSGMLQFGCAIVGFCLILALQIFIEYSQEPEVDRTFFHGY